MVFLERGVPLGGVKTGEMPDIAEENWKGLIP
jgi:hypothetical protein